MIKSSFFLSDGHFALARHRGFGRASSPVVLSALIGFALVIHPVALFCADKLG